MKRILFLITVAVLALAALLSALKLGDRRLRTRDRRRRAPVRSRRLTPTATALVTSS
jgi:hypothetical protein